MWSAFFRALLWCSAALGRPLCVVCLGPVVVARRLETYTAPFGPSIRYEVQVCTCRRCGAVGDFLNHNTPVIEAAIDLADQASVAGLLEELLAAGQTPAFLERTHRLPAGTLRRWRAGDCPPEGLALLRALRRALSPRQEAA